MNIVVLDGYGLNPGDLTWDPIKALGHLTVYDRTSDQEIIRRAANADIILTNKTILTAGTLQSLPKLKYIGILSTGYNVVDIEAAKGKGIVVCNIPTYSTDSVAQMTFAHLLNITNQVGHYAEENRNGRWNSSLDFCYWDTPIMELAGKKFGIIGLGHIGEAVARIARAFGMDVYAYTSRTADSLPQYIKKVNLEDLFRECDIISLHCPLTAQTRQIINSESLSYMKPSAILINTGRGHLVNEQDLAEALNNGNIAAYGADVLCVEPAIPTNPLLTAKNVYLTPHIAWASTEARKRLMDICTENIKAFINGTPQNVIQ